MHARSAAACATSLLLLLWQSGTFSQAPSFDLVIKGGRVVDGTGSPWFASDVGIKGDRITALAPNIDAAGAPILDATGLVVSPGFIDVHAHADAGLSPGSPQGPDPLRRSDGQDLIGNPAAENNIRQGVTTVISGPDGFGTPRVDAFLASVTAAHPAVNLGAFVGHNAVRAEVVGMDDRAATEAELQRMKDLVRSAMQAGAFGLSTGLFYVPGSYAPLQEIIDLARVAGEYGGIHQSHVRDEGARVVDSVRDTIAIGENGHLPTQVTHHKTMGKANWGRTAETLRLIDEARARGVDATVDVYPYTAASTSIQAGLLPPWAQEGGREAILNRLKDESALRRLLKEVASAIENDFGGGSPSNVVLASCDFDPGLAGKSLADILRERRRPVANDTAADLVVEIVQRGGCSAVFHAISEDDLVRVMKHPASMIASDATVIPILGMGVPHPRAYGTFARVLAVYVREKKVLTLEEAVRKMAGFPAQRIGLTDRGIIRPGMKADLIVFNPATVVDRATFEKPHQYAEGVSDVIVNGHRTLKRGQMTGDRAGMALRHAQVQ